MTFFFRPNSLAKRIATLLGDTNSLREKLVRGGVGVGFVKTAGSIATLMVSVLLARMLKPEGYGVYAYVLAWISVLAIPAQFGLSTLVIRETANAEVARNWHLVGGLWTWANRAVGWMSLGLISGAILLAWANLEQFSFEYIVTFGFGLLLIPLISLTNLRGALLCGLRHVVIGQLPDLFFRPFLFLSFLVIAFLITSDASLTPAVAMCLHALSAFLVLLASAFMLHRIRPLGFTHFDVNHIPSSGWLKAAIPLGLLAGAQLIVQNTDVIMLGMITSPSDVGVYRVVLSVSSLVAFGLGAINLAIAPFLTRLYGQQEKVKLQRLATASARLSVLLALPITLVLVFAGEMLITVVFGSAYSGGVLALSILAAAQLINAVAGPAGLLLNMTGHEGDTLRGIGIAAMCNVALNFLFIPWYGINGAAISTGISLVIWNVLLWRSAWKRTGVNTSVFGMVSITG